VQLVAVGNAFNGGDVAACGLSRQHGAGFYRSPVDMDDAGAALAGITAYMGAGQIEVFAQDVNKEGSILNVYRYSLPVDRQIDCRHA
jgi:hypothetical protein